MLSCATNMGTLLSAKAREERDPACRICHKYARISSNLMSRCAMIFLFWISELPSKHSSALHSCLSIYIHAFTIFYIYVCVCICIYAYMYIYPPTSTYVWIHSTGNYNLDALALIMHKSDVCWSEYVAHHAYTHIHLFSTCVVKNKPVYRCAQHHCVLLWECEWMKLAHGTGYLSQTKRQQNHLI